MLFAEGDHFCLGIPPSPLSLCLPLRPHEPSPFRVTVSVVVFVQLTFKQSVREIVCMQLQTFLGDTVCSTGSDDLSASLPSIAILRFRCCVVDVSAELGSKTLPFDGL